MRPATFILLALTAVLSVTSSYFFNELSKSKNQNSELTQVKDAQAELIEELKDQNDEYREDINNLGKSKDEISKELLMKMKEIKNKEKLLKEAEKTLEEKSKTHESLTNELKDEIKRKEVKITELNGKINVRLKDKILFPSGSSRLSEEGMKIVTRIGKIIGKDRSKIIRIEGHTDSSGSAQKRFAR